MGRTGNAHDLAAERFVNHFSQPAVASLFHGTRQAMGFRRALASSSPRKRSFAGSHFSFRPRSKARRLHREKPEDDLALVAAVREAVGTKMDVMVDANQAGKKPGDAPPVWDFERTLMMAKELDAMGVYWLEEPLNRFAYDDLARVRQQLKRMHLAGGEGNVGLRDFREMLGKGAYSYLQPDPVVSGPVSVVRKIAALAEAHGVLFGPHHGKSGVGMMASLHMQCAAPNSGYLEYMYDPGFWNPEGFQAGFAQPYPIDKEGYIHVLTLSGLGIEWDRAFFKRHGLELE